MLFCGKVQNFAQQQRIVASAGLVPTQVAIQGLDDDKPFRGAQIKPLRYNYTGTQFVYSEVELFLAE